MNTNNILKTSAAGVLGFLAGGISMIYRCGFRLNKKNEEVRKFVEYFELFDKWMVLKERGITLQQYFLNRNIQTAAIYGMGKAGKHLRLELENLNIPVAYIIDEGENTFYQEKIVYSARDELPAVDIVIVTPISEFKEIKEQIEKKNKQIIVSLKEIIDAVYEKNGNI